MIDEAKALEHVANYREDWCAFARDVLGARLDPEQQAILRAVQTDKRVSVASGTSRGKDYIAAVASVCFLYLTPEWDEKDPTRLIRNTKVAMTAPTDRQVGNIMAPEISRLFREAHRRGYDLNGRLTSYDIRTDWPEWFLTGFKADEYNTEAWTGFHAANTMFVVTEATGLPQLVYDAILGNLQGNSRILIVFNPNVTTGFAAATQRSPHWTKFKLSSLTAPNVVAKKELITGQVDYEWVQLLLAEHATPIQESDVVEEEDDFYFEDQWYRPDDLFRVKVLGCFPKVSSDTLIPPQWIEKANARWVEWNQTPNKNLSTKLSLGVDVAGMGKDSTCLIPRYENIVTEILAKNSGGKADHMETTGRVVTFLKAHPDGVALIDTIGEGAGVYSRLDELGYAQDIHRGAPVGLVVNQRVWKRAYSAKFSEKAKDPSGNPFTDITGEYKFANMRAYLYWCLRDWLNPANGMEAMLPPHPRLFQQLTEIKWAFRSDGSILLEPKEKIKERLGYSPDESDTLATTFYPVTRPIDNPHQLTKGKLGFF